VNFFVLLSAVGLPLVMVAGAIAALRNSKKETREEVEKPQWRDDSLDAWRRERDAETEAQRLERLSTNPGDRHEGSAEERETKKKKHQRIGG
jgi:hypothetical protein